MLILAALPASARPNEARQSVDLSEPMLVRKDAKDLSAKEKRDFVNAVLKLKATASPFRSGLSYYDQFVVWHQSLMSCDPSDPTMKMPMMMGHAGPAFLPWHRLYVRLFERALQQVSHRPIAVPYWDWSDPASTAAVFSPDLMGGTGDPSKGFAVTTGPFRQGKWKLTIMPQGREANSATEYITRNVGAGPAESLPKASDIRTALTAPRYDVAPYSQDSDPRVSFRNALEGFFPGAVKMSCSQEGVMESDFDPSVPPTMHNQAHAWVGGFVGFTEQGLPRLGTMLQISVSPNDPVFFLNHSNVDRLWAQWQATHCGITYEPASGFPMNSAGDNMQPFDQAGIKVSPSQVEYLRPLGYRYDTGGGCKEKRPRPAQGPAEGQQSPPASVKPGADPTRHEGHQHVHELH
ncbi:tyrosinase family protein [Streptomyces nigra]|uniref:tyrosinase family protein n=1 Tax=Streptomyces nigra TaxID=1827580 RepID=UPI00364845D8